MTSPNGQIPPGSAQTGSGSASGMSAFAAKTGDQWKAEATNQVGSRYQGPGGFLGRLISFLFGGFANGIAGFISSLFGGLTGTSGGGFGDLLGWLTGVGNNANNAKAAADAATADAASAKTAAQQANNKVTALLQGGTRTIYTSNFTYTKSSDLVKLGVLLYGGGLQGGAAGYNSPGGLPGGVIYQEFSADLIPASVVVTIGPGGTASSPSYTSFGNLLRTPDNGGGIVLNSTLTQMSTSAFPGAGGKSGASGNSGDTGSNDGSPGASTALASGGAGGTSASPAGKAGGNAATNLQYLAGGGGGGGGRGRNDALAPAGNGGAGGFPGGGGGGAGRNLYDASFVGGYGAQGLCALIEFKAVS